MKASETDPEKPIRYTELSLESLQEYLQNLYPEEKILTVNGTFEESFLQDLLKTEEGKPAYILYETSSCKYKMLLVFQLKNNKFHLNVLSSLGINLCDETPYYHRFVRYIFDVFTIYFDTLGFSLKYNDSYTQRQPDESNCSALIIDDMRIARDLIAKGETFDLYKNGPLNYEFLKTCRAGLKHGPLDFGDENNWSYNNHEKTNGYIEKEYLLPMSKRDSTILNLDRVLVNSKATLLSLKLLEYYIANKAVFTPSKVERISTSDIKQG